MTRQDFNEYLERAFERSRNTLLKKSKEYSTVEDVFHNFNQGVKLSMHNERESTAWEFMTKHMQSVKDIVSSIEVGGEVHEFPTQEYLDEKIGDWLNYILLIEAMIHERIVKYENTKTHRSCKTAKELGIEFHNKHNTTSTQDHIMD